MAPPRIWRWLRSYWPKSQGRPAPLSRRTCPCLEQLEDRLTPATLLDAAGSLAIFLGSNEHLSIVSNASTYTFTSNEGFTDGGVSNPGDFSPFGSGSLTLLASGISRYSSIAILDESEGSGNNSVTFDDSGVNSYANDFSINLSNAGGPITFNGQSQFGAASLQAETSGNIVFSGPSSISSTSGNIVLVTAVGGAIEIGAGGATFNGAVVLDSSSVTSAGPLTFGNSASNTLTFNGEVEIAATDVTLNAATTANGTLSFDLGTGTFLQSSGAVINLGGHSLRVEAATILVNDDVSTTGDGAIALTALRNIAVTGTSTAVSVVDGDLTLDANTAGTMSGTFSGIDIVGGLVTTAGTGNLILSGKGGDDGFDNQGVLVRGGGVVSSTATGPSAGTVTLTGAATGTIFTFGVLIRDPGTQVSSVSGAIAIDGTSTGTSFINTGVYVQLGGAVVSTGTGVDAADITITGTANGGTENNSGVVLFGVGSATNGISAVDGDISVTGTGSGFEGRFSDGIRIQDRSFIVTTGDGVIALSGTATRNGGLGIGIRVTDDLGLGALVAAQGTGSVSLSGQSTNEPGILVDTSSVAVALSVVPLTLIADTITIDAASTIQTSATGTVTLKPLTSGRTIELGGDDSGSQLGLSDAELDRITTGTLEIGDDDSGTIAIGAEISRPSATTVRLTSGSSINFSGGSLNTSGGGLTIAPGSSAQVSPSTAATDVSAATLDFTAGTTLRVALGGTSVDTQYEQLRASGTVDLTGVDLLLAGTFVPAGGNVFTIVSATSIVGTFAGLAEGDTVPFNGMVLQVRYTATSVTLVARDFALTGAAPEDRLRPFAIINQVFTTRLATIDVVPSATAVEFVATIDWGDGTMTSGDVQPTQTPARFAVVGSHTYTTENTFAVSVTVTLLGSIVKQVFAGSAVVLTADQSEELERFDFEFLPPGGGSLSADTEDVQATLLQPDGSNSSVTLSVAEFDDSPVPDEFVARDFPTDQVQVAGFFDVRVTGAVRGTRATVVFEYDARGDPIPALLFFDPDINDFVPVLGSTVLAFSLVVDPVRETVSVDFDSFSTPPITEFSGTVFAISVPLTPTGPPRDAPPAAPTPTPFVTTTASLTPSVAIATAQASPRNVAVRDGEGSPRVTVSFRSSTQRSLLVNSSQDSARTLAVRSAGAVEEGKGEGQEEKQPDNKEKPPEDPKQPPDKKENKSVNQEKDPEQETGNKTPPATPNPKSGNNKELPDKKRESELPPELLDAHFSSGEEEDSGSWAAAFGLAVLALPRSPHQRGRRLQLTR